MGRPRLVDAAYRHEADIAGLPPNSRPAMPGHDGESAAPMKRRLHYCGPRPAVCAIAAHLRVSSAMNFPKSCGEPDAGCAPTLARLSRTSCDFKPSLIAALSLLTMSDPAIHEEAQHTRTVKL